MSVFEAPRRLLDSLATRHRLRHLRPAEGLDFASNDYLGLAGSAMVQGLAQEALARGVPLGAGAARLLRGNHPAFERLEALAAQHFGASAALYFGSGYAANLGLFAALPQQRDLVLYDALIHASTRDGLRLGAAEAQAFRHNDADAARDALVGWRRAGGKGQVWLAVESLYSMDGDRAPLADFAALARDTGAMLVVDEAHATGIFGPGGRGLAADWAAEPFLVSLHTCGKALGGQGALICAARPLIELLVNRARSFIYSTAPSPLLAEVLCGILEHLATDPSRRETLLARIEDLAWRSSCLGLAPSHSQIQPILIAGDSLCLAASARLQAQGFDVRAIRSPTVPKGGERLRLSLTLNVTPTDLDALFHAFFLLREDP